MTQHNILMYKTTLYPYKLIFLRTQQQYNITIRLNKTQNNIVTLKNNNVTLLNNITKHKTKLLSTKQQYNKIRHKIVL